MSRNALDLSRISEGTESQIAKVALQTLQDQVTQTRADEGYSFVQNQGDQSLNGTPGRTPGDAANGPMTRAQTTLVEAMKGFNTAKNGFEGIEKYGSMFETAIKQSDEDFTTRMTAMKAEYDKEKPQIDKADQAMEAAEQGVISTLRGMKGEEQQIAAVMALEYMARGGSKSGIKLDDAPEPYKAIAAALTEWDKVQTENAPILDKMKQWRATMQELVLDRFRTRVAYGAAMDYAGMSARAQEMYKEGFGMIGMEVPERLKPRKDPNIRQASNQTGDEHQIRSAMVRSA